MLALGSVENEKLKMLEEFLDEHNFPKSWYCLGRGMDDAICIEPYDGKWYVYYVEHGRFENIIDHSHFEDAACDFLSRFGKEYSAQNMTDLREYLGINDSGYKRRYPPNRECTAVVDPQEVAEKVIVISHGSSRPHPRGIKINYERNSRTAKKTREREYGKAHFLESRKSNKNGLRSEKKNGPLIGTKKGKAK